MRRNPVSAMPYTFLLLAELVAIAAIVLWVAYGG